VLALPCLLYSMDLTVLYLAVPALTRDLEPSATELLWIMDIYGFFVAGALITMGTLGDRYGRRRLLLIGAAVFGIASVLAAFSHNAGMLIATRALLGIAGATVAPSTMSLIRNMFHDPREFTTAIGVWVSSYSAGAAVGPLLGGLLLEHFWWGSVFLLNVPVMLLVLVLGPLLLPEYRDRQAGRPDLLSAAISVLAVLSVINGLKLTVQQGGPSGLASLSIGVGLALGLLFVRRQRRLADPLIDLRLFANRAFSSGLLVYALSLLAAFGVFLFVPQYLQLVRGLSPLEAGVWTLGFPIAFAVGSTLTPKIADRFAPSTLIAGGLVLAAAGNALLTQVGVDSSLELFVLANVLVALGLSPAVTLGNDLIIGSAPPERAGAASGLSETAAELAIALGIAVLGSIGTTVYRAYLAAALPGDVPATAVLAARETLAGAVDAASQLPLPLGQALRQTAQSGFIQGLQLSAGISAAVALVIAGLAAVLLRGVRTGAAPRSGAA
jgi:DHA2 family multidrug resistance protein-like MFS transporter